MSIRPPTASCECGCVDDDYFNIKFVSHFVDVPDNDQTNNENQKTDDIKNEKDFESHVKFGRSSSPSAKPSKSPSHTKKPSQRDTDKGKDSKNKNASSRPDRKSPTSDGTERTEPRGSEKTRGMSNSNKRTSSSKTPRGSISSDEDFDDEEFSRSSPASSSDEKDVNDGVLAEYKPQHLDEKEIVFLYGQIRQIIRGPAANDPTDVQLLSAVEVADAKEGKETLFPTTVVTELPCFVDPAKTSTRHDDPDNQRHNTATVYRNGEKEDDDGLSTAGVREAVAEADRAVCARIARMLLLKSQSHDPDGKRSSSETSKTSPCSLGAPQTPRIRDDADDVGEPRLTGRVPAEWTSLLHDCATSPRLGDLPSSTDDRSNISAAAAAANVSQSARSPASHHRSSLPAEHHRRDPVASPRPFEAKIRDQLEHLLSTAVSAHLAVEQGVDPTDSENKNQPYRPETHTSTSANEQSELHSSRVEHRHRDRRPYHEQVSHVLSPVIANGYVEPGVDQRERSVELANVVAQPSTSLPLTPVARPPTSNSSSSAKPSPSASHTRRPPGWDTPDTKNTNESSRPGINSWTSDNEGSELLTSCLKYRSITTQDSNPQLRRRIRFAEDVKQRTLAQ